MEPHSTKGNDTPGPSEDDTWQANEDGSSTAAPPVPGREPNPEPDPAPAPDEDGFGDLPDNGEDEEQRPGRTAA